MMRDVAAGIDETLFSRSLDGMVVVSTEGRVVAANTAAERILGSAPLVDRGVHDVVPAEWLDALVTHIARGATGFDRHEFVRTAEIGQTIESRASRILDGAVLLTLHDTTDRKRFEQGLVRAARMESVAQLAGGLAHDFNNLLAGISGHLTLLRHEHGMPEGALARLEKAERILTRAAGLARRLLVLGRGGAARAPVAVDAVVLVAADLVRASFPSDVKLDVEVSPGLPILHARAQELEECIINLLLNARDASPARGTVTLRAQARSGCVEITVDDEGTGIPERDRARVFEPFFTTKPATNGTGLGLAVVARVVREHGGTVEVAPGHADGTRMVVRFPVAMAESSDPPNRPTTRATTGANEAARRALVVEDEEDVRSSVAALLTLVGYTVATAASAEAAWTELASGPSPDVLLTDVRMPGENGLQLAARTAERYPSVQIVVMTGFATQLEAWPQFRDGTWRFIAKPFRPDELLEAVGARAAEPGRAARPSGVDEHG